ncbi:MAG: response regulator [Candidatus Marinimicrobia bacterium]|nr:response regulator [Candidatus Neomarinimicrobiota bacterium]
MKKENDIKMKNTILILEDSKIQRIQIIDELKRDDREIISTGSILEAKEIYDSNKFKIGLFILDLKLPDGNGVEFLEYVRESLNVAPAIIQSGFLSQNIISRARELGIIEFFEKPIQITNLVLVVEEYFNDNINANKKKKIMFIVN